MCTVRKLYTLHFKFFIYNGLSMVTNNRGRPSRAAKRVSDPGMILLLLLVPAHSSYSSPMYCCFLFIWRKTPIYSLNFYLFICSAASLPRCSHSQTCLFTVSDDASGRWVLDDSVELIERRATDPWPTYTRWSKRAESTRPENRAISVSGINKTVEYDEIPCLTQ